MVGVKCPPRSPTGDAVWGSDMMWCVLNTHIVAVTYLVKNIMEKERRAPCDSQSEGTVHQGGNIVASESQAAGQEVEAWCSSMFSPLCSALDPSPCDGTTHTETSSSPLTQAL